MTFDLGGYTPDFVKSMPATCRSKMAERRRRRRQLGQQGLAMLGLMQQLTFNSASAALRRRLADRTRSSTSWPSMQGQKPADIVNQAKAIVPFMMMRS